MTVKVSTGKLLIWVICARYTCIGFCLMKVYLQHLTMTLLIVMSYGVFREHFYTSVNKKINIRVIYNLIFSEILRMKYSLH